MKFLAIDGAMRNFGLAVGHFDKTLTFNSLKLIQTKPQKSRIKSFDDYRCVKEILAGVRPLADSVDIIFAEVYTGSISNRGAVSLVSAMSIIASLNKPTVLVTPFQVKAITGNKKAEKHDMVDWAYTRHPKLNWLAIGGRLLKKNEHLADAICVAYAGVDLYRRKGHKVIR